MRAELRGEGEERLVEFTSGGDLHAAGGAGDGDGGCASQAERRSVAQEAAARLAVIGAGREASHGRAGQQDELVRGEEIVHTRAKCIVTPAEGRNFIGREACAPLEAIADGGFNLVEVAGVQQRGL